MKPIENKNSESSDGKITIDSYKKCVCGANLIDSFTERRDVSKRGRKQRAIFGNILKILTDKGIEKTIARLELLKIIQGKKSTVLEKIGIVIN